MEWELLHRTQEMCETCALQPHRASLSMTGDRKPPWRQEHKAPWPAVLLLLLLLSQGAAPSALALADSVSSYSGLQLSYSFHGLTAMVRWLPELSLVLFLPPITEDVHFTSLDRFIDALLVLYKTHWEIPKSRRASLLQCTSVPTGNKCSMQSKCQLYLFLNLWQLYLS